MAHMIAGQSYDQAGLDFVLDYTNRLGFANMEQFIQAQIASGMDTQAFAYAQAANKPAQQATPDITTLMAAMMQMMHTFQNPVMGVGVVPNGVQSVPGQPDMHLANARMDERAFRRLEKFTNKREDWREWKCASLLL